MTDKTPRERAKEWADLLISTKGIPGRQEHTTNLAREFLAALGEIDRLKDEISALTHEGRQGELEQANVGLANENVRLAQALVTTRDVVNEMECREDEDCDHCFLDHEMIAPALASTPLTAKALKVREAEKAVIEAARKLWRRETREGEFQFQRQLWQALMALDALEKEGPT